MSIRGTLIALCAVTAASAHADTPREPSKPEENPTEARCRADAEVGERLLEQRFYDKARERFHAARRRCATTRSLVMIARAYQEQGDLPRALAYIEEFLAVAGKEHELRVAMEKAAAELRERVPAAQRVNIAAELSAESATSVATDDQASADQQQRLNKSVEDFDWRPTARASSSGQRRSDRARGFFVGANLAYAATAKVEVGTERMDGKVDFPAVFAAQLQAGYRLFPFLSVALAPQMFFNMRPKQEDPAHELEVFAQVTGHLPIVRRWDLTLFVAPGYSVVFIPGADDARGLAFRWGGGPMFHLNEHVSFTAEFSRQTGFQGTERDSGDVDMETSFFSLLAGVFLRL